MNESQQPQAFAQAPAAHPVKKSLLSATANAVACNSYVSLAIIVILIIMVIGLYVYYHGILGLGPFASRGPAARKPGARGKGQEADEESDKKSDEKSDPETERLIDSINNAR